MDPALSRCRRSCRVVVDQRLTIMTLSIPLDYATITVAQDILLREGVSADTVARLMPAIADARTAQELACAMCAMLKWTDGTDGGRLRAVYRHAIQVLWDTLDMDAAKAAEEVE